MSTRYLEILSMQPPFAFRVDDNNRVVFTSNFVALAAAPVEKFEEEIAKILSDAGLATLGTDTFIGPQSVLPVGNGPYITIMNTGGMAPLETQNEDKYERRTVQLLIRATNYETARTRALGVWRELDGKRSVTVTA